MATNAQMPPRPPMPKPVPKTAPAALREARLKAALKANMARRKSQAIARRAQDAVHNENEG
jgi:hypothetical protein